VPYGVNGTFGGWSGKLQSIPYRDLYRRLITKLQASEVVSHELPAQKESSPSKHRMHDERGLSFLNSNGEICTQWDCLNLDDWRSLLLRRALFPAYQLIPTMTPSGAITEYKTLVMPIGSRGHGLAAETNLARDTCYATVLAAAYRRRYSHQACDGLRDLVAAQPNSRKG
jgi:hypothetical protein